MAVIDRDRQAAAKSTRESGVVFVFILIMNHSKLLLATTYLTLLEKRLSNSPGMLAV